MTSPKKTAISPESSYADAATRGIVDATQDGIWDWDLESGRVYYSPQWLLLAGYGAATPADTPETWLSRLHDDDKASVNKLIALLIANKTARLRSEHRLFQADGSYRWVLARGAATMRRRGAPSRIAGTLTDISAYKQREQHLTAQLDELRFALASEKVLMEELDRKNRELRELSITDGLTGLYNHRFLQERFDFEFKRVRRYGGALSCLLIDIDHFKSLNDNFGHQYGDYVLREIAAIIKKQSREVDICGRYGGEEFVVISNVEGHNALSYAVKLHAAIENYRFEHPSRKVRVTVSIGVAHYDNEIKTKQELIERADMAMYQAKNDGRNLIRVWREPDGADALSADRRGIVRLKEQFHEISGRLRAAYIESVGALVNVVEERDPAAAGHAAEVARHAVAIAKQLRLSAEEIDIVRSGALLHDVGKISVPDGVLHKKRLSERERRLLNRHPEVGATMLKDIEFLEKELPVILYHHERYDGKGFPHGLKGREIPLGARIVAVADAYDSMVAGRSGGEKLPVAAACAGLTQEKAKKFSPEIVEALIAALAVRGVSRGSRTGRHVRTTARGGV